MPFHRLRDIGTGLQEDRIPASRICPTDEVNQESMGRALAELATQSTQVPISTAKYAQP